MSAIYVGTYAAYNSGSLRGGWINLDGHDKESFWEAVNELHAEELAATGEIEPMFQDWEGIPSGLIGESWISDDFWEWLELDDDEKELLAVYLEHVDQDGDINAARDAYRGTFDSPSEWAEDELEQSGLIDKVPEPLRGYIDFESYARDAGYNGMVFAKLNGRVWVFDPH